MDFMDYENRRNNCVYKILGDSGEVVNTIISSESFVSQNFKDYEFVKTLVNADMERYWRDQQLKDTDSLMLLSDYPNKVKLEEYRQLLRDWPGTEDFPEKRPVSFEEFLNTPEETEAV